MNMVRSLNTISPPMCVRACEHHKTEFSPHVAVCVSACTFSLSMRERPQTFWGHPKTKPTQPSSVCSVPSTPSQFHFQIKQVVRGGLPAGGGDGRHTRNITSRVYSDGVGALCCCCCAFCLVWRRLRRTPEGRTCVNVCVWAGQDCQHCEATLKWNYRNKTLAKQNKNYYVQLCCD